MAVKAFIGRFKVVKVAKNQFFRKTPPYMRVYRESYTQKQKNHYFYYFNGREEVCYHILDR